MVSKNSYSDKFGGQLFKYFTSTKNKQWWKRRYENKKTGINSTNGKFKSVSSADSLKNVCEEAYKASMTDIKDNSSDTEFSKEEAWKFCSKGETKPKNLSKNSGESYVRISMSEESQIVLKNKSKLLSITFPDTQWIREIKEKERKDSDESTNFPGTSDGHENIFLKNLKTSGKTIKDVCKSIYLARAYSRHNDDIKRWCTLGI